MTDDTCIQCGRTRRARTGSKSKRLCASCYSKWYRENRKRTKACAGCGQPFKTARAEVRFCGASCAGKYANSKVSTSPKWAEYQDRVQANKKPPKSPKTVVWISHQCIHCQASFISPHPSRYCTPRCGQRAKEGRRYERRGEFGITDARRRAIYERDGYTCHLCAMPVDPTLHYLDPMSATLDHLIPQSLMLVPDHSDQNLKLAHRRCNSERGNSPLTA